MAAGLFGDICRIPARSWSPSQVKPTWFSRCPIFEKLKAGLEAMLASLPEEQQCQAEKGLEMSIQKVRADRPGRRSRRGR